MSESLKRTKVIKVGILGDKYVGKTYLCHKLTGRFYEGYEETASIAQFRSLQSQQSRKFMYIDNPAIDNLSIINIGSVHQYDVLVFMFKDCDSFTKLFEFFETIKQTLDSQQNHHVRQYWSQPKKIIAVYSNFQSVIDVNVYQLFTILIDEIKQFCKKVIFQTFIWKRQQDNWKDLKLLIQKQPIPLSINKEVSDITKQAKISTLVKQESYIQGRNSRQKANPKEKYKIRQQQHFIPNKEMTRQIPNVRKTIIVQRIRQSFIFEQNRKSTYGGSQSNNKNLLDNFRQSQGKPDPKIDQQLDKYNKEKAEKLHKYVQVSDEQSSKKVSLQTNKKQIQPNPQVTIQIPKKIQKQTKPESQFSNKNYNQKKVKDNGCGCCQIM